MNQRKLLGVLAMMGGLLTACGTGRSGTRAPETQGEAAESNWESRRSTAGQGFAEPPGGREEGSANYDEAPSDIGSGREARLAPRGRVPASAPSEAPEASGNSGAPARSERPGAYDRAPEPEFRPGLATRWGETRESRVSSAPFERSNEHSPSLTSRLFYNDRDGLSAMLRGSSFSAGAYTERRDQPLVVRLVSPSGQEFTTYQRGGDRFVVGEEGRRYLIEIENHTGNRYEAVASVDGLDVIDGRAANTSKRGYLVGPWSTLRIEGFRQSQDHVAAFRFGSVRDSYAASKGDDRNVGVIGVAFFDEAGQRVPDYETERRLDADPFPGRFAEPPRW